MGACIIVPAFDAASTLGTVLTELRGVLGLPIVVVDDGSTDATQVVARDHGASVVRHARNRGKGAALKTGLEEAARRGHRIAVSVDADGQHPAASALTVLQAGDDARALVLGVRDLVSDGAPSRNQFGNAVSNFFVSTFAGRPLRDTQCGLRRYPVPESLELACRSNRYGFEAEIVLRAIGAGLPVVEVLISAVYPSPSGRSHFRGWVDPTRIVFTVALTAAQIRLRSLVGGGLC